MRSPPSTRDSPILFKARPFSDHPHPILIPPSGKFHAELELDAEHFAAQFDLMDYLDELKKGAIIAQDPQGE